LAQTHPTWRNRGFDDALLRPWLVQRYSNVRVSTVSADRALIARQLAQQWDAKFGPLYTHAARIHQMSRLTAVAEAFLIRFAQELTQ
jgi:hypothetical protein